MAKLGKKHSTLPSGDAPAPKAAEEDPDVTPFDLFVISEDVSKGKADASQARRLLEIFCDEVDADAPIHRWLLLHLKESFRRYFDNKTQGMESAFGLKRRKGRPSASEAERTSIAADVSQLRIQGVRHQEALEQVAASRGCAESLVGQAFAAYPQAGVLLLRSKRPDDFTAAEKVILHDILDRRQNAAWKLAVGDTDPGTTSILHAGTISSTWKIEY